MGRVMRIIRDLMTIFESFRRSLNSLFWSIVMLAFSLYIFALLFVQGVVGLFLLEGDSIDEELKDAALKHFGSVLRTIVSLYMAVTGGNDWAVYYVIIEQCGWLYCIAFLLFTFFFIFALFNILTGIFVEKAVLASQPDRDELILEQSRKARKETEDFRSLCNQLDTDGSGTITLEEFVASMQDERMVSYMASVGLEVHDVEFFFRLIAGPTKHEELEIDLEDFVAGCMSMKGPASGLDMQRELFETTRLHKQLKVLENTLISSMHHLTDIVRR